ncbi:MAG: PQQ-binding-like beta-propeller repeat protein, partial [Verrucomicrobiales bacterium]
MDKVRTLCNKFPGYSLESNREISAATTTVMMKRSQRHALLLGAVFLSLAPLSEGSETGSWNALRGPAGDGRAEGSLLVKTTDVRLEIVWKQPIGSASSSVSVEGGRAVTMFDQGDTGYLACFDVDSGEILWKIPTGPATAGANGAFDGAISTPCIHGGRVFSLTPQGVLSAVSIETGERAWQVDLVKDLGATPSLYGFGASPMVYGDELLLMVGPPVGTIAAFSLETGELLWGVGEDVANYQHPIVVDHSGVPTLVVAGETEVTGVDLSSGESAWSFAHEGRGARGAWSTVPVALPGDRVFLAYDDLFSKVVSLAGSASGGAGEVVWEGRSIRNSYNVPVLVGANLYAYSSRAFGCVDSETGELLWRSANPGDGFLSAVDGHLVMLTKRGTLHLAEASSDDYRGLASVELFADPSWCVPAV